MLANIIAYAQEGNQEAMLQLIARFQPSLRKHAKLLKYEDSYYDLVALFIESIHRMKLEKLKNKSEGATVNYVVNSIYHSYCKLVEIAAEQRRFPCSLEELNGRQIYTSASCNPPTYSKLELPCNLLTSREVHVIRLLYEKGLSVTEVASKLHITRQSVNQTKLRAESKLKSYYENHTE